LAVFALAIVVAGCSGLSEGRTASATRIDTPSGMEEITIIAKGLE
jgi:hypothetical protein